MKYFTSIILSFLIACSSIQSHPSLRGTGGPTSSGNGSNPGGGSCSNTTTYPMNVFRDNNAPSTDTTLTAAQSVNIPAAGGLFSPIAEGYSLIDIYGTQAILSVTTHLQVQIQCVTGPCQATIQIGVSNVPNGGAGLWASCPMAPWNGDDHPSNVVIDIPTTGQNVYPVVLRTDLLYPTSTCWTAAAASGPFATAGGLTGTAVCAKWRMAATSGAAGNQTRSNYAGIQASVTNSGSNSIKVIGTTGNTEIYSETHILYGSAS